jgi:hypothetical protein
MRTANWLWWGNNVPNNVAARLDPVVQHGQASFGDQVGETHGCECVMCIWRGDVKGRMVLCGGQKDNLGKTFRSESPSGKIYVNLGALTRYVQLPCT